MLHGKGARGETLRQVDLGTDGVGQVAHHEDVLDVVVEVVLDGLGGDLGSQREVVHHELAQGLVGVALLVEDLADVAGAALQQVLGLGDGGGEGLDVRDERGLARLVVGRSSNSLEGGAVRVALGQPVGHLDEEARLGRAVGVNGSRGGDVRVGLDVLAWLGGDGQVNGGVGEGARLGGGEEVLDEGGEAVELEAGGVPTQQGLARAGLEGQLQHGALVLNVDLDLLLILDVGDGEGVAHLDLSAILGPHAYQGANDAGLGCVWRGVFWGSVVAADGMVENGEDCLESGDKKISEAEHTRGRWQMRARRGGLLVAGG